MYRNETQSHKLKMLRGFITQSPRTDFECGEGGKEIENHGRSRVIRFSQETGFKSQLSPRIGGTGFAKKSCAGCARLSDSTPLFFILDHSKTFLQREVLL
jgi:hypothetical protein